MLVYKCNDDKILTEAIAVKLSEHYVTWPNGKRSGVQDWNGRWYSTAAEAVEASRQRLRSRVASGRQTLSAVELDLAQFEQHFWAQVSATVPPPQPDENLSAALCLHCGSRAQFLGPLGSGGPPRFIWEIRCTECGSSMQGTGYTSEEAKARVLAKWERRSSDRAPRLADAGADTALKELARVLGVPASATDQELLAAAAREITALRVKDGRND